MRADRELLRDALFLIESGSRGGEAHDITEEIRARLAEPEDEPVRWLSSTGRVYRDKMAALMNDNFNEPIPLYRHPRQPVRLSDEEIDNVCFVWRCRGTHLTELVRDMETAFIEKNQ